jgi:hypothetical protein
MDVEVELVYGGEVGTGIDLGQILGVDDRTCLSDGTDSRVCAGRRRCSADGTTFREGSAVPPGAQAMQAAAIVRTS